MAKFKFRLEILLTLAKNREEELKKELALWQKRKHEALESLAKIEDQIIIAGREKVAKKNIQDILVYEFFLEKLRNDKQIKEDEVEYFTIEVDKTIQKLAEAMKERKMLEKLKEKKLAQYQEEQDFIEQKELDEVGTNIFLEGR